MGVDGIGEYAEKLIRIKARKLARTAASPEADWEDFAQDMRLDLWRRLSKFDPNKAGQNTFAARIIDHCIASIIEARTSPCRDHRRCPRSLNELLKNKREKGPPVESGCLLDREVVYRRTGVPSHSPEELHDLALDIAAVVSNLPQEQRDFCLRLMRKNLTQVAKGTGIPRGTLYESIEALRRRFRKAGLEIYL